jgi:hypothetical protein
MCMVSNIGDEWGKTFPQKWPQFPHEDTTSPAPIVIREGVSQADFDALKKEVEELKKLLAAAKEFDARTGQPHCEMDAKVKLIKEIAKLVGVELGDVFEAPK